MNVRRANSEIAIIARHLSLASLLVMDLKNAEFSIPKPRGKWTKADYERQGAERNAIERVNEIKMSGG